MRTSSVVVLAFMAAAALSAVSSAQETKPVPKGSVRVAVPGCTKGYIFTAGPRMIEQPGNFEIREGMHLRMNGPKKLLNEIKAHEGSMIELVGLMKKGQYNDGISIGGGVSPDSGLGSPTAGQIQINVEGWRQIDGSCHTK